MSGNVTPYVDFNNSTDTGENNTSSIAPITNGETINQTTLQRPDENLRLRTEALRALMTDSLYLQNADRSIVIAGPGLVTWPGSTTASATGIPELSDVLWVIPMLTPGSAQTAPVPPVASAYGTLHLKRASDSANAILVTSQRRSYAAGDQINVTVSAGSVYSCTLQTEASGAYHRTIKIVATPTTTLGTVIASLTSLTPPAPDNTQLVTATLEGGALNSDLILDTQARQFVSGNYDGEGHAITPANLASFFTSNPTQALAEGDTLCVQFAMLSDTASTGGRRQAIPENSNTAITAGMFFNSRVHPEKIVGALPICKVINGALVFATGAEVAAGTTNVSLSAPSAYSALLRNASFEHGVTADSGKYGITEWFNRSDLAVNGAWRLGTTTVNDGAKSLEFNKTDVGASTARIEQQLEFPVTAGQNIKVTAAVRQLIAPTAGGYSLVLYWGDADSAASGSSTVTLQVLSTTDGAFRTVESTVAVPAGKYFLKRVALEVVAVTSGSTGVALVVDTVQVYAENPTTITIAAADNSRLGHAQIAAMILEDPLTFQLGQLAMLGRFDKSTPTNEGKMVLERKDQDYTGGKLPPALELKGRMVGLGGQLLDATNTVKPRIEMDYTTVAATYTLLWESARNGEPAGSYTKPATRLYVSSDGLFVQTINAEWTGTEWAKDVSALRAARFNMTTTGMGFWSYRGTVNFAELDWERVELGGFTSHDAATDPAYPMLQTTAPSTVENGLGNDLTLIGCDHLGFPTGGFTTFVQQNWMGTIATSSLPGNEGTWTVNKFNTATVVTAVTDYIAGRALEVYLDDNNDEVQFFSPTVMKGTGGASSIAQLNIETYSNEYPFPNLEAAFGLLIDPSDSLTPGIYLRKDPDEDWHFICCNGTTATDVVIGSALSQAHYFTIEVYGADIYGTPRAICRSYNGAVLAAVTTNLPTTQNLPIAGQIRSTAIGLSGTVWVAPITFRMRRVPWG